jgi:hypothetical protein
MRSIFPAASVVAVIGVWLTIAQAAQPASWGLRIDVTQSPASADSSAPQL